MVDIGWNAGLSYQMIGEGRLDASPTIMYGYNGVLKMTDSNYNNVSYGITVGLNVIIKSKKNDNN